MIDPPTEHARRGPLAGVRVLEVGGIGPVPFAGMVLTDLGADVLRLDRPRPERGDPRLDLTLRGRPTVRVDLKHPDARPAVLELCDRADVLVEGFRPGVMERLGLGPDDVHARRPELVYGRATGWGQDGPLARAAGHDVNYIAVAGALGAMARAGERPLFPLNLVGDYAGGALLLTIGVLSALHHARATGEGQVVDAAMVDGAALLTTLFHGLRAAGRWSDEPGTNLLDSGAPFYEVYATADDGHVAVGALEPVFYARLLELLGVPAEEMPQHDRARWPAFKRRLAAIFASRDREHWRALLEGEDACATVVESLTEAPHHPHLRARGTFVVVDGVVQPQAAPRFSATPTAARPPAASAARARALRRWGVDADAPAAWLTD
ncbi:MAG: CaiB/BaiF CoA transferase family protein [Solirubrobacteraceae bacterium]